jgi:hypothetical protein
MAPVYRHKEFPAIAGGLLDPEKLKYLKANDMWAFGVVCLRLLSPTIMIDKRAKIRAKKGAFAKLFVKAFEKYEKRYPGYNLEVVKKVIGGCLQVDITKVITAAHALSTIESYYH